MSNRQPSAELEVEFGHSMAHVAATARSLGLSETPGKWAVTPTVRAALAGRALAEVLPGPRGLWPEDVREVAQ